MANLSPLPNQNKNAGPTNPSGPEKRRAGTWIPQRGAPRGCGACERPPWGRKRLGTGRVQALASRRKCGGSLRASPCRPRRGLSQRDAARTGSSADSCRRACLPPSIALPHASSQFRSAPLPISTLIEIRKLGNSVRECAQARITFASRCVGLQPTKVCSHVTGATRARICLHVFASPLSHLCEGFASAAGELAFKHSMHAARCRFFAAARAAAPA